MIVSRHHSLELLVILLYIFPELLKMNLSVWLNTKVDYKYNTFGLSSA